MERINATTGSYNFIDLFAGAGGLSEGFIQAGFSPVAHVEMNPYAAQTLETRTGYYYLKAQGKGYLLNCKLYGGVPMNLSLKHKLMLQSLSPLAFLTIVRNFKFTPVSELAENQSYWGEFVRLSDIVQIDSRADVIIFSSSVVTAKMDLMQRFFGFEQYIRAGAQKTIEIIRDLDIVDSLEKFVAFENKSKLTNAKKLLKAKNSPVLQMKKNDLLENLKKHSRYKTMFKFEEDHIVISSQKEASAFIKMLNDDIVRSELTGKEYDSSSKMLLGPVGASH